MLRTGILNPKLNGTRLFSTGDYWSVSSFIGRYEKLTSSNVDVLISFCCCLGLFDTGVIYGDLCLSWQPIFWRWKQKARKKKVSLCVKWQDFIWYWTPAAVVTPLWKRADTSLRCLKLCIWRGKKNRLSRISLENHKRARAVVLSAGIMLIL